MEPTSLEEFYRQIATFFPEEISQEIGHFNLFDVSEMAARYKQKPFMPYSRRSYYKISLVQGRNRAEYADKVIDIDGSALLFASPQIPYHWIPLDDNQTGYFCVFTNDFLSKTKTGVVLDGFPIFKSHGFPVLQLTDDQTQEIASLFKKMSKELSSDYVYKYDLLRNYVLELIHYGQKLQPVAAVYTNHNASLRIASLFIELLERQFPVESSRQTLKLRTASDYAARLAVHVNHLNKVLKETTGKTTTDLIRQRVVQESKILLKHTNWNVSEISSCLGFEEVAHFSNFFKKQTAQSPMAFREGSHS